MRLHIMKSQKILFFFLLLLSNVYGAITTALRKSSLPITGIDTTVIVPIGGIQQYLSFKGKDTTKPLLLFLHGGPGSSLMKVADQFTQKLQDHFIVVQWDQRETGATLALNPSPEKLTAELLQKDTETMITYLLQHFNQKKLYLVSHSWGSVLGFDIAVKHPELLYAYIPISPIIDQQKGAALTQAMLEKWAQKTKNETAIQELALVHIPFESPDDLFYSQKWLFIHNGVDFAQKDDFKATYYKWLDIWFPMWKASVRGSLFTKIPEVQCPIYFFEGNGDKQKSHDLVLDYYRFLKAPKKKLFWFRKSGHTVFNTEPDKIQQLLIETVLPETYTN